MDWRIQRKWRLLPFVAMLCLHLIPLRAQMPPGVRNASGLRLTVEVENYQPSLRIELPDSAKAVHPILVLFPEHVTVRKRRSSESEHLYLFRPGKRGDPTLWLQTGHSLQYERAFKSGVQMLARATLENDGVLFHYEFENRSDVAFEMVLAVTDPRLTSIFHDVRLERTYVHHKDGFDLLASETPARLSMPLEQWLPARYLVSYTWPVPAQRVEHRDDGITYYNKSRPVDEPLVATFSEDRKWVVASFTRTTGNVWSNPELTCLHVDPEAPLPPRGRASLEVKILVFQGSLDQVLEKVKSQRSLLK